jgi:Ca2+-dependent lipid-binding protein
VLIVRAKDLRADDGDSSDPYCVVEFINARPVEGHGNDLKVTAKTQYRSSTLNPQWNELFTMHINLVREAPVPPLHVTAFDHDAMPGGDDFLGDCLIDLTPAIKTQPCTWAVDDYFELNDP